MQTFEVEVIGRVQGGRPEPRDDHWAAVESVIAIDPAVLPVEALAGLLDFSHLEVVFLFDRVDPARVRRGARHPRNRQDWPLVGILAQRGKSRPNRLGVSRCELVGVEGHAIRVRGLDAIDGTPVLDIKPWMEEFGVRGEVRQAAWSRELMAEYYAE